MFRKVGRIVPVIIGIGAIPVFAIDFMVPFVAKKACNDQVVMDRSNLSLGKRSGVLNNVKLLADAENYTSPHVVAVEKVFFELEADLATLKTLEVSGVDLHVERRGLMTYNYREAVDALSAGPASAKKEKTHVKKKPTKKAMCDVVLRDVKATLRIANFGPIKGPPVSLVIPKMVIPMSEKTMSSAPLFVGSLITQLSLAVIATAAENGTNLAKAGLGAAQRHVPGALTLTDAFSGVWTHFWANKGRFNEKVEREIQRGLQWRTQNA